MERFKAFARGVSEFRQDLTWADPKRSDDDPYTLLDEWYDLGRETAHRVTLRRWDY